MIAKVHVFEIALPISVQKKRFLGNKSCYFMKILIYNSSWLAPWPVFFSQLNKGTEKKPVWLAELFLFSAYFLVLFFAYK